MRIFLPFLDAGWKHMPQTGRAVFRCPDTPDGYFALHERFGSKNFAELDAEQGT